MESVAIFLLIAVAFMAAAGNLFFKKAALLKNNSFIRKFFSFYFISGGILFVCCPVISSYCARFVDFSVMYAMTSLNFVFVLLLSRIFLKETIDRYKIGGVTLILAGIMLVVFS